MMSYKVSRRIALKVAHSAGWLVPALGFFALVLSTGLAQAPIQRDPQAISILTQSITAGGGAALLNSIQDLKETGTVTYSLDKESSGSVTVKVRGLQEFRIDSDLPEGRRSIVVNQTGGSLTEPEGQLRPLNRQSVQDLWSFSIPYFSLLKALQDPTAKILYLGLVNHNGVSAHDIRIENVYTPAQDPSGLLGAQEAREVYIDPNTNLVDSISDQVHIGGIADEGVPHEILYSNYHSEGGIPMPLTIQETARGVTGVVIQLNQVTFNTGLSDSSFSM